MLTGKKDKAILTLVVLGSLLMGLIVSAEAGLFGFGEDRWQEEVLLHDGNTIIITRSQTYGGRHEIGQPAPIKEHTVTFTPPGFNQHITWTSEYSEDIGRTNFNPLALHILNNTPYIVVEPNLMLSYNKWGRPNPPYVFFKYDGKAWQRIPLETFPTEFKTINLVVETMVYGQTLAGHALTSTEMVKKLNSNLTQEEYQSIVRTPLDRWKPRPPSSNSGRMVRTKDGWVGMDWFENQPSIEACLKLCEKKRVSPQDCPCHTLFKDK